MKTSFGLIAFFCFMSSYSFAHGDEEQQYKRVQNTNPSVFIISPKNGETVTKNFKVVFGIKGMAISPAGIEKANSGHHHLLVDGAKLPDLTVPLGSTVRHFGKGQTSTTLSLEPGEHTLQLILADHLHRPHDPAIVSTKISIKVQ